MNVPDDKITHRKTEAGVLALSRRDFLPPLLINTPFVLCGMSVLLIDFSGTSASNLLLISQDATVALASCSFSFYRTLDDIKSIQGLTRAAGQWYLSAALASIYAIAVSTVLDFDAKNIIPGGISNTKTILVVLLKTMYIAVLITSMMATIFLLRAILRVPRPLNDS